LHTGIVFVEGKDNTVLKDYKIFYKVFEIFYKILKLNKRCFGA